MIIYPAIDLSKGNVVRLEQGIMNKMTVFSSDPENQAAKFVSLGAKWIHVVDLDGAFSGRTENESEIKNILKNKNINVQLGGGIRSLESIEKWINLGVSRVVLGTAAINNINFAKEACENFPGQIAVGLDVKDDKVATDGWKNSSEISLEYYLKYFSSIGVSKIIYTDIKRDGVLKGPNIENINKIVKNTNVPIIASGGVSCYQDLLDIKACQVEGAIVGRAIYDGFLDLKKSIINISKEKAC